MKTPRTSTLAVVTTLLLSLTLASHAQLSNLVKGGSQMESAGLESTADTFEIDQKSGWVTFTGNVRITSGDHTLTADKVKLHQESGEVQARGNVVIRQSGFGTYTGSYIEYNYKTGRGLTGESEVRIGPFRAVAHEVTRSDEDGRIDASYVRISTCTNDPSRWHWCAAGHGRFKDNDYAEVFHVVPYLFGVPFGYVPYWYRDLDTHYGFRLIPGYTSKWGGYLLSGYRYNLYRSPREAGPSLDAATKLDYRTRRGVAVGQNLYWDMDELGRGKIEGYYAWDQDPPRKRRDRNWVSKVNESRYRLRLRHEADLTPRDQLIARGIFTSDSEMSSDFFDRHNRDESVPMNFVSLQHREHSWAAGVTASGPLNNFYSGTSRLPEGWLSIMPQPLLLGVNYESQTRAGYLNRDPARYQRAILPEFRYYPGEWADYNTTRIDTAHRLTYPMKFADLLSVVPRAGYRGTFYGDAERRNDVFRHTADLGIESSIRGTADFDNGYRHVFSPYIDYSYQPTRYSHARYGKNYYFDRYDRSIEWLDQFGFDGRWLPHDWHGVRPGIRNLLQKRDDNNTLRTLAEMDNYVGIQFDSEGNIHQEGVRIIGTQLLLYPTDDLDIKLLGEWDERNNAVAHTDLSAFYRINEHYRLGGGYLGRNHDIYDYQISPVSQWNQVRENLIYGGFTHDINDAWSWSTFCRYDLRRNDLDEVGGYIQYRLDCLVFQIRSSYVNRYRRIDDISKRDDDFRVAVMMWLRAEKRTPVDDWLTW